jgi:DNA (cytosine-5)-methyltransferase 1
MAGFWVLGIDNRPQPRYCGDAFIQADALRPPVRLEDFDLIWASPPCQHASIGARRWIAVGREYPELITATRAMLEAAGGPFIIENVPGALVRPDLVLTGAMFGIPTYRRRHFELSFFALQPDHGRPFGPLTRPGSFTAAGNGGHGPNRPRLWAEGMGVEWMTDKHEIAQAVPPAYAAFIGRAALHHINGSEKAA